ncbi:hypothetical protein E2C01_039167 [Portunus trituberculatus]|uniref:Uncharacterized protein n=1 Tax=Portunus trituberculatus TaxID=210409 RepID=A0A5B7FIW9_PORTR|nr:hypothetical protein [Portunus trituberculatus]
MNSLSGEASGLLQSYCIRPLHPYMGRRDAAPRGVKGGREARESLWGEETLHGAKHRVGVAAGKTEAGGEERTEQEQSLR